MEFSDADASNEAAETLVFSASLSRIVREWLYWGPAAAVVAALVLHYGSGAAWPTAWAFGIGAALVALVFYAGRYVLLGVRAVTLSAEGLALAPWFGKTHHLAWDEITNLWLNRKWTFETARRRYGLRDDGFSTQDWSELAEYIYLFKSVLPVTSDLGVKVDGDSGVVFTPQYEASFKVSLVVFPLLLLFSAVKTIAAPFEEPMLAFGAVLFLPVLLLLPRLLLRRVVLGEASFAVRFVLGSERVAAYEDVARVGANHVQVRGWRLHISLMGMKNGDVLLRLLGPHLREGQLSGQANRQAYLSVQALPWSLLVVPPLVGLLWWLHVPGAWWMPALLTGWVVGYAGVYLFLRHR